MRKTLTAIICWLGLTGCAGDQVPDESTFTHEYVAALGRAVPGLKIDIMERLTLRVIDSSGKEKRVFLHNCYAECRIAPAEWRATMQKYIVAYSEPEPANDQLDLGRIIPVVKDRPWLAEMQASTASLGSGKGMEHVFDDLNDELVIVYAEDTPKNIRYLTPESFLKSGLARADLRTRAIANLRSILPKMEIHGTHGLYMITAGGDYEACLILLDEIWQERKIEVDGDYVIAIPARDMLFVTGSRNMVGIEKLRELARKTVAEASYRLTSDLFIRRDGHFSKYAP